jgi:hypothetical protein
MKDNKLIAEFMGLPTEVFKSGKLNYYFREFNSGSWYEEHELSYNVSWDWLIPVIDKCYQEHMSKHIAEAVMTCNINEAYKVVVEFIKEYNDNKRKD